MTDRLYSEGYTQNREISWLRYDERVLEEALDDSVPLFERLNFISIFFSNLEEFFKVRVGGLLDRSDDADGEVDPKSGLTDEQQLDAIYELIPELLRRKDSIFAEVEAGLREEGFVRVGFNEINAAERKKCREFFESDVRPNITVTFFSGSDEMPYINENRDYIIAGLNSETDEQYALIDMSDEMSGILVLNPGLSAGSEFRYILVTDIIKNMLDSAVAPFFCEESYVFDIARNNDFDAENYADGALDAMREVIRKRDTGDPDKLIIDGYMSEKMTNMLLRSFNLEKRQIFVSFPINLEYMGELEDMMPERLRSGLCYPAFEPFNQRKLMSGTVMDKVLAGGDILSAYPYDSMDVFLDLLKEASTDERVKEIRITVYRLASHPVIVDYLADAASNGKKVKVLIELRARFDETKNMEWAAKLKEKGCKVTFGNEKYKVHSKLCQIVLEGADGKKQYITQISTGNYNEKTSRKYTDLSLITCDRRIGKDADDFFDDVLKGKTGRYKHLVTSPKTMRDELLELIKREKDKGRDGRIFIKANSVSDTEIIRALMEASCAGCKIRMVVRGICCILPGIKYCTENITVVNVVGRFLEHSRVYMFGEGRDEVMYISSADLMKRNLSDRVEIACPVYSGIIRNRIREIMVLNYNDNVKGRVMRSDGKYVHKKSSGRSVDSQSELMKLSR